ncbi:hypothetical protein F5X97DRAFT_283582 [Nemania serpens]|nr:hypothetical protein F5X97DRAFT_283582 [Nemania serpens]
MPNRTGSGRDTSCRVGVNNCGLFWIIIAAMMFGAVSKSPVRPRGPIYLVLSFSHAQSVLPSSYHLMMVRHTMNM